MIDWGGRRLILTAHHVLTPEQGKNIPATGERPEPVPIEVRRGRKSVLKQTAVYLGGSKTADLAVLTPSDPAELPEGASVAPEDAQIAPGESAWFCGKGSGLKWNLVKTIVNQETDNTLIVNGEVWYGHSGSGVFVVREGRPVLVGVVCRAVNIESPKTAAHCAPLSDIHRLLRSLK